MVRDVTRIRQRKDEFLPPQQHQTARFEFLPWTSSPGPLGLRTLIMRQFHLSLNKVIPLIDDQSKKIDIYQQCVELADFVLEGYKAQMDSIWDEGRQKAVMKMYERDRGSLIMALVHNGNFHNFFYFHFTFEKVVK